MNALPTFDPWLAPLGWLVLEAAVVALAALAAQPFLRTAAARRSLWRAALLALVAILAAELTGTGSQLPAQLRLAWQTTFPAPVPPPVAPAPFIPASVELLPISDLPPPIPSEPLPDPLPFTSEPLAPQPPPSLHHSTTPSRPSPWPAFLWLAGLAALLTRAAWTHAGFAWLRLRHFLPAAEALCERAQNLAARLGLRRRVRVLASERLRAPAAFGWMRPGVAVPGDFTARFAPAQQDVMLAHELAHLAARDPLWQLLADLTVAALWWHPLAWVARHQHRLAAELAADDASQALPDGPVVLAECLLVLGQEAAAAPRAPLGMAGFRSQLGRRVERLVALPRRDWSAPGPLRLALQTTTALLALAALALLPGCAANRAAGEAPPRLVAKWWQAKSKTPETQPRGATLLIQPQPKPVTVEGRVRFNGTPPPEREISLPPHVLAARTNAPLKTRFHCISPDGGLADVLVYVKSGLEGQTFAAPTNAFVVRADQYEFAPYIGAIQAGQTVRWESRLASGLSIHPTPTNPENREFNFTLMANKPLDARFTGPEFFLRVKTDVFPWMFHYLSILPHPFFAVTDADGRFRFPQPLPPGKYTLAAVHRQTGEAVRELDLTKPAPASQPPEIEFVLSTKVFPPYRVVAGDELSVAVYKRDDLRTRGKVQPDGTLTLPLIGAVSVAGKTISEVRNAIRDAYQPAHMTEAHITVSLVQSAPRLAPPPLLSTPKQASDFAPSKPPTREELLERKARVEAQIKAAEPIFLPSHPKLVGLRKQLESIEEALKQTPAGVDGSFFGKAVPGKTGVQPLGFEVAGVTPQATNTIDISVGRQLFVDDFLIASNSLKRTWHQPSLVGTPQLTVKSTGPLRGEFPFPEAAWYDAASQEFRLRFAFRTNNGFFRSVGGTNWSTTNSGAARGFSLTNASSSTERPNWASTDYESHRVTLSRVPPRPGELSSSGLYLSLGARGIPTPVPPERAFIPLPQPADGAQWSDLHPLTNGFLVVGRDLRFYFGGRVQREGDTHPMPTVGLATLRRDGFASLDAGPEGGVMTTKPVVFRGKLLCVNLKTNAPDGELRVEILHPDGRPVELTPNETSGKRIALSLANSRPLADDQTLLTASWVGGLNFIDSLAGRPVRFRFHLKNASLYSFWVADSITGRSMGAIAGGGPNFNAATDTVGIGSYAPLRLKEGALGAGDFLRAEISYRQGTNNQTLRMDRHISSAGYFPVPLLSRAVVVAGKTIEEAQASIREGFLGAGFEAVEVKLTKTDPPPPALRPVPAKSPKAEVAPSPVGDDVRSLTPTRNADGGTRNEEASQRLVTSSPTIAPGDVLRLIVAEDDSYNADYPVRRDGTITVKAVGRVAVGGKGLRDAEVAVKALLEEAQLRTATVTLTFRTKVTATIPVTPPPFTLHFAGEFVTPGLLVLPPEFKPTLLNAIPRAGGITTNGDLARVKLLRIKSGQGIVEEFNVANLLADKARGDETLLQSGDIIMVPALAPVVKRAVALNQPAPEPLRGPARLAHGTALMREVEQARQRLRQIQGAEPNPGEPKPDIHAEVRMFSKLADAMREIEAEARLLEVLNVRYRELNLEQEPVPPGRPAELRASLDKESNKIVGRLRQALDAFNQLAGGSPAPKPGASAPAPSPQTPDARHQTPPVGQSRVTSSPTNAAPLHHQPTVEKLARIRLPEVTYDGLPLPEVLKFLKADAKKYDPDKAGVDFGMQSIYTNTAFIGYDSPPPEFSGEVKAQSVGSGTVGVRLNANVPLPRTRIRQVVRTDMDTTLVHVSTVLRDVSVLDALDAIVKTAGAAIGYTVETNRVVFRPRVPGHEFKSPRASVNAPGAAVRALAEKIVFPSVIYDGLPLPEVVNLLTADARKHDPDKRGVNFMFTSYFPDPPVQPPDEFPLLDPQGKPLLIHPEPVPVRPDLWTALVHVSQAARGLTLAQTLDLICKSADVRWPNGRAAGLTYAFEDYGIIFRCRFGEPLPAPSASSRVAAETLRARLDRIVIPRVEFRARSLGETLKELAALARDHDPDRRGVNLLTTRHFPDRPAGWRGPVIGLDGKLLPPPIPPARFGGGSPQSTVAWTVLAPSDQPDLEELFIGLPKPMIGQPLPRVLDAICQASPYPITYRVEAYGVLITPDYAPRPVPVNAPAKQPEPAEPPKPGASAPAPSLQTPDARRQTPPTSQRLVTSSPTPVQLAAASPKGVTLPVPNPYHRTNSEVPFLTHSSKGAQRINRKLEEIVLPEVHFDAVPLVGVVQRLIEDAKKFDPEKKGLNFLINDVAPAAPLLDAAGNPVPVARPVALSEGLVRVTQPLKNLTLRQALDVICKTAELPTQFSVEEYAIAFIPRGPVAYYSRMFRVNPDTFMQGLQGVVGNPVLGVTPGGGNQPGAAGQSQPTTTPAAPVRATVPATVPATQRTAAEANAIVRQFFQSAGVTALGATNGSTRVTFNPENGLLLVRGTTNDLHLIEQAIQKVQPLTK